MKIQNTVFGLVAGTIAACSSVGEVAAQGYTVRIEPRPFYGAVVTLEEGVRVFRPLPPDRYVIINPDNATPLSLNISEQRVYENRVVRNYNENAGEPARQGGYGGGFPLVGKPVHPHKPKPHRPGSH